MSSISGEECEAVESEPVRRTRSGRAVKAVATSIKKTPAKRPTRSTRASKNVQELDEQNDVPENGVQQDIVEEVQESVAPTLTDEVNDIIEEQHELVFEQEIQMEENEAMDTMEGHVFMQEQIQGEFINEESQSNQETANIPELDDQAPPLEENLEDQCIVLEDENAQQFEFEVMQENSDSKQPNEEIILTNQDEFAMGQVSQTTEENSQETLHASSIPIHTEDQKNHENDALQEDSQVLTLNHEDDDELLSKKEEPETEAVSEDELPTETATKEPETEAVSDEELPVAPPTDLGETESVSEDELPPESDKKRKSSKSVSKTPEKKPKLDSATKRKRIAEGEYDPSSPTSENNDETPAKKAALSTDNSSGEKEEAKATSPKKKTLPELDKYWKAVNEDPTDFTGWTYLLQYVDQENDAEAARDAYNKFLERYPYCYGYWRKYADYEKKKGDPEKVQTVFDQGLKAISLSVDLWLHYINHCKSQFEKDEEKMREQYERAINACGLEFRSDKLWESYIKWEVDNKHLNRVLGIYDRLLQTPTLNYTTHFETFQEFISTNAPNKILNVDDFLSLRAQVKALLKGDETAAAPADDAPPGEDLPPNEAPPTDEETRAIREKIISSRRKLHKVNVNAVAARWNFEEGIKRPYFHVKPLERCQLKNWKEYLDYEIEQKDQNRIIILFERCLIACALYDEFWMRFIRYLESLKGDNTAKIRDVYYRACTVHHQRKPNLHLQWATFEESQGNYVKAAEILENIDNVTPNMLQIAYRRINLERRRGDMEKVSFLYEHYINTSKNKTISNNISVKYARFLCKIRNDIDKAIQVLLKATEKDKDNPRLYLQLIDLSLQRNTINTQEVVGYMDMFIEREHADAEQKVLFAQRKVEFLEDFSSDIRQVLKAHEQFQKCIKQAKERKKAKEDLKSDSLKKVKVDTSNSSTPSQVSSQSSYQYNAGTTGAYQTQQFQSSQYTSQSGYQQSYQQYPPPSDPNYANYQNWQYGQSGQTYTPYNQWGSYNYY